MSAVILGSDHTFLEMTRVRVKGLSMGKILAGLKDDTFQLTNVSFRSILGEEVWRARGEGACLSLNIHVDTIEGKERTVC